eukprot:7060359-Prymnesium_polylepis.1
MSFSRNSSAEVKVITASSNSGMYLGESMAPLRTSEGPPRVPPRRAVRDAACTPRCVVAHQSSPTAAFAGPLR